MRRNRRSEGRPADGPTTMPVRSCNTFVPRRRPRRLPDGGSGGAISPQNTVNYYSSVLVKMGSQQQDWLRLFMVPGMEHCGGGPGPDQVNWMAALERWRESGIAPDRLIASRVRDNRVNM